MKDLNIIGAEVYAVLSNVSKEKQNKVPPKVFNTFKKYEKYSNNVVIIPNVEFEQQNISKESKDIIFTIALNYWLTEEEREKVLNSMQENEKRKSDKYNPDKIFEEFSEKKNKNYQNKEVVKVEKKERWYVKIINKIKSLLKK